MNMIKALFGRKEKSSPTLQSQPLYRHGDVILQQVAEVPDAAKARPTLILARGELTGHAHRIETPGTATIHEAFGEFFVNVTADTANLIHDEHANIELPRGVYKFWHQREYSPEAIRQIID